MDIFGQMQPVLENPKATEILAKKLRGECPKTTSQLFKEALTKKLTVLTFSHTPYIQHITAPKAGISFLFP